MAPLIVYPIWTSAVSKRWRNVIYCLFLIHLIFLTGLRWKTGTDWDAYLNWFNGKRELDVAFDWFDWFKHIPNFVSFNILVSLIYYGGVFYYFCKTVKGGAVYGASLFVAYTFGALGANRQMIALSVFLLALTCETKTCRWFLFTVSCFLHPSMLIGAPLALRLFSNISDNRIIVYGFLAIVLVSTSILYSEDILKLLFGLARERGIFSLEVYSDNMLSGSSNVRPSVYGVLRRLLLLGVFIVYQKRFNLPRDKVLFLIFLFVLYISFRNLLPVIVNRGVAFMLFIEAELFVLLIPKIPSNYRPTFFFMILIYILLSLFLSLQRYYDLFIPYQFVL